MDQAAVIDDDPKSVLDNTPIDRQSGRHSRRRFLILLDGGSVALFWIFLVRLVPIVLEIDALDPKWQGEFVDVLVNQGVIAFLGFVMLHLGEFIQPANDRLRRRLRLVRRLAVFAVLGYLMLVPLQLSSTIGDVLSAQSRKDRYLDQGARLSEVREALQDAGTMQDLNVRLNSLLQPSLTSEQMAQPLPELRKTLLEKNDIEQKKLNQAMMKNAQDVDSFVAVISRVGSALGWALAFAAGAVPWGSHSTLFERARQR